MRIPGLIMAAVAVGVLGAVATDHLLSPIEADNTKIVAKAVATTGFNFGLVGAAEARGHRGGGYNRNYDRGGGGKESTGRKGHPTGNKSYGKKDPPRHKPPKDKPKHGCKGDCKPHKPPRNPPPRTPPPSDYPPPETTFVPPPATGGCTRALSQAAWNFDKLNGGTEARDRLREGKYPNGTCTEICSDHPQEYGVNPEYCGLPKVAESVPTTYRHKYDACVYEPQRHPELCAVDEPVFKTP